MPWNRLRGTTSLPPRRHIANLAATMTVRSQRAWSIGSDRRSTSGSMPASALVRDGHARQQRSHGQVSTRHSGSAPESALASPASQPFWLTAMAIAQQRSSLWSGPFSRSLAWGRRWYVSTAAPYADDCPRRAAATPSATTRGSAIHLQRIHRRGSSPRYGLEIAGLELGQGSRETAISRRRRRRSRRTLHHQRADREVGN